MISSANSNMAYGTWTEEMKRQAAMEVKRSPHQWITISEMAAPWPLSIHYVDSSKYISNCHYFWIRGKLGKWVRRNQEIQNPIDNWDRPNQEIRNPIDSTHFGPIFEFFNTHVNKMRTCGAQLYIFTNNSIENTNHSQKRRLV